MSKLLKTRRGHDSEDDYSDADTDISTDIDEESIHSISEVEQSDFDYEDDASDVEDSENRYKKTDEDRDPEIVEKDKEQTEKHQNELSEKNITQDDEQFDSLKSNQEAETVPVEEIDYDTTKEKRIQEHREYRRKLAEDPSFVPYVGLFWSHDDRYRDDAFSDTRGASGSNNSGTGSDIRFSTSHKTGGNTDRSMDPLMHKKWDHSGYEELLRLEEQEERRKREVIENGQEYENNSEFNKSNQRGRGNYSGRNGHHNNGQRYHNFNNYHRNRNHQQQHRQTKPVEEWPQLSDSTTSKNTTATTPTSVDNHAWATATPELLKSHNDGPSTGILVDVENPEKTSDNAQNQEPEVVQDVAIVNAWGSIDRAEEIETLNQDSVEVETNIPLSDERKKSDTKVTEWGVETVKPSSDGREIQDSNVSISDKRESETPSSKNDWNTSKSVKNWTNDDSQTTQSKHSSTWEQLNKSSEVVGRRNEKKEKEQVPDQFMDAESQIGSPVLSTAKKPSIPNEEKASNSWAEMSANAEPEKNYSNNYRRQRDTFSPRERSFTPRGRNKYEENNRGYRRQNDRGYSKQHYNSRSPATQQSQEDNWNSTVENIEWVKTAPATQPETAGDSWGVIDKKTSADGEGWGGTSTEAVNATTKNEATAGWGTSPAPADTPAETTTSGWGETPTEVSTSTEPVTNGWGTPSTTAEKTRSGWKPSPETNNSTSGWDVSPAPAESSKTGWGTSPVPVDSSKSGWDTSSTNAEPSFELNTPPVVSEQSSSRWGHSNEYISKQRQSGWSNGQSSNSSNWNADKKARMNKQIEKQPRKGRGYLSQKLETTPSPPIDTAPVPVKEEYSNHGDSDSDVEIILEADEEPEWVKNEQILGMTAPGEDRYPSANVEESPKASENYTRDYESSSSQPESSYRNTGRNHNHNRKPRRNFDENWRQRDEVLSDGENRPANAVPMYYPQPHHHINTGNITYLPMIPNGPNGSPMYAMPFPMGMPSSSPIAGSASPNNSVGGSDSSPHINNSNVKFYSPMINGPNGLQLPPGYEANGMVYYGMDPSSMYGAQPIYYYGPPVPGAGQPMLSAQQRSSPNGPTNDDNLAEEGWGPPPDVDDSEEQWNNRKPSPTGNYHNSSAYYVYRHQ